MVYPEKYQGREQTFLKHQILREYLRSWSQKLASFSDRLWFVDAFSGPWESQDPEGTDTSAFIGLGALNEAVDFQRSRGREVRAGAILVEPSRRSFSALEGLVARHAGAVAAHPLEGTFGDNVGRILALIQADPAFILVDPKGWKGADMRYITDLTRAPRRDVMVNVMYDFLNRFVGVPWDFLREQMTDLFGIDDTEIPKDHDEEQLMGFYRTRLREDTGLTHVADLSVPVPDKDRTYYRLVLGSRHPLALDLFRSAEKKVIGQIASLVRTSAKEEHRAPSPQMQMFAPIAPPVDALYAEASARGCREAEAALRRLLESGPRRFEVLWPSILEECHITLTDLKDCVRKMERQGVVSVRRAPGKRSVADGDVLELPARPD